MKQTTEELVRQGGIPAVTDNQDDDLLVVSASFEPRTTFVAEHLSSDYKVRHAIIYVNMEFMDGKAGRLVRPNLYRLVEMLAHHSDQVSVIEGSWLSAVEQIQSLRPALTNVGSNGGTTRITLDCTTFNREALLTTVLILRATYQNLDLRVLYASPHSHGKWLSRGYRAVRNVMGLSGVHFPSRPTVVAILSGFEPQRTQKVIEEHEPAMVLLGIGDPPTSKEFLERNLSEQKLVLARQEVDEFRFPTSDIYECTKVLGDVLARHVNDNNIVLAPMSTKFSTISALLVAETLPEIQVTYCLPGEYNIEQYSEGVRALFSEILPSSTT